MVPVRVPLERVRITIEEGLRCGPQWSKFSGNLDLATVVPPACLYFEWDQLLSLELCSSAAESIVDRLAEALFGCLLDA